VNSIRCANHDCTATRRNDEGKLFRLDLEVGSVTGESEHHVEYLWLCPKCSLTLQPKVRVCGDSVQLRLTQNCLTSPRIPPQAAAHPASLRLSVN